MKSIQKACQKAMSLLLITLLALFSTQPVPGQKKKSDDGYKLPSLGAMKFRSVGPALTSGRIADIAVHPDSPKVYYVAVASGGIWKTENAGTTYEPIFDGYGSYSVGCITIDPNNPNIVWAGTGENNNQRSVAYGDGVYRSMDGGRSWKNMGLKDSEHIAKIVVHPEDSRTVYVAAQGPLWSSGGDRGLYKTTDGGESWDRILFVDEHTGVTDLVMDPRDPDVLYAATHQRQRKVFTYIGGGPGSGLKKSTDGGQTWTDIKSGLPGAEIGRIGLAISPADPEIIYAIVEAAEGKGGFYKSTDRGASWQKQSGYSTSGNYYQEIFADPVDPDKVYSMNVYMQYTKDGGKNFQRVGEADKHVDNHALWINPADTDHLLAGCDGGIYESFDGGQTWHFKENLPVTQFYKVTVDNDLPFYHIYGGTQDNYSLGGPSRSISANGISNEEWFITNGGDGFESAVDPDNPDIVYAQSQYGFLIRYDRKSGERLGIKPHPRQGEDDYRWNWDAPLMASTHKPGRLYFAANKLFRSDDRGNSWEVISDDLTRQIDRNTLKVMGKVWSVDATRKNLSTSPYGTIVAFSESPKDEELLYVGTDDGLVQVTENGGQSWREAKSAPEVPERTYVNAVLGSAHDGNVVYAAFNNHKNGDFRPYLFKSTNRGRSWKSISGNLPERGSVYAVAEDPVNPNLLFAGTEFGLFVTLDGGSHWTQMKSGLPVIAVRDIAIQERENDLVLATFGRGFYVLDDYSALRTLEGKKSEEAVIFPIRKALAYEKSRPLGGSGRGFLGSSYYLGDNMDSEAMFTYFVKNDLKTKRQERKAREKKTQDDTYPSYEAYKAEELEDAPYLLFSIKNEQGEIVRKLKAAAGKGLKRTSWDLRYASSSPVSARGNGRPGTLVPAGSYSVELSLFRDGEFRDLAGPVSFEVEHMKNKSVPSNGAELDAFRQDLQEMRRQLSIVQRRMGELEDELSLIEKAILATPKGQEVLTASYLKVRDEFRRIQEGLGGDDTKTTLDISAPMSLSSRLGLTARESLGSSSNPTQTHKESLRIFKEEFPPLRDALRTLVNGEWKKLRDQLNEFGAPYTPNREIRY